MRSALLATVLYVLLAPPAAALPPGGAAWVVSEDTTLEGIPFVLAQDVVVMPGAALRLKDVDALVARPVNLTVRGTLEFTSGTSVAAAALPFQLYVEPGATLRVLDSALVGAQLVLAGDARLERASLTNGALRQLAGATTARDVALHGSTGALTEARGGSLDIERADLDGAGAAAVFVGPAGALRLANATIGRTGDYGLRIEGGSADVENVTFALSPEYALYAKSAVVSVVDSTFATHCGAFLVTGTTGVLARNVFTTFDHGVTLVNAGAVDVHDNLFDGTQTALTLFGSAPDVRRNAFTDNLAGVHALLGSTSAPTLRDNSFLANGVAVKNEGASTLDASLNWWGAATGPGAGATSGAVTTSPWLTSAP